MVFPVNVLLRNPIIGVLTLSSLVGCLMYCTCTHCTQMYLVTSTRGRWTRKPGKLMHLMGSKTNFSYLQIDILMISTIHEQTCCFLKSESFIKMQYFHRVIKAGFLDVLGSPFRSELTNTGSKAFKTVQYTHNILGLQSPADSWPWQWKISYSHAMFDQSFLPNTKRSP